MTPREERGLIIAAMCKLTRQGQTWLVPSQTASDKKYTVDPMKGTCTCPDHAENGHRCKHLFAVTFTIKREFAADGSVTETREVTFSEKKVYSQNWEKYNLAQSTEKDRFQVLLHELCN